MKIERTKNATRNIVFGGILKVYQIVVPFLMRTAMIYLMGVQYLGLTGLFTSILQVLNLAELGVGSAMVYSMYKPIAEDNKKEICALMRLYRSYYRIIGLVVAVLGIVIIPVLPKLITGEVPQGIDIYVLYLLNLGTTVLSYWLFAYKNCLLSAHQRTDVTSKISLITTTIQYAVQLAVLYFFRDYYLYLIVALVTQVLANVVTAVVVTKYYPDYVPKGKLDVTITKEINHRIRDLFTAKLGGTVVNSADTIVISAFMGLTALAMYQNYYYLMTSVIGFVMVIFSACTAGIGNSLITESIDKNYFDYKRLTFLITWISTICVCCFACLYQPVMEIWVGKQLMFDMSVVVLFCIYFYLYTLNQLACVYKDAGGIWHEDRFRPLVASLVNLTLNLLFVRTAGIYAILLSTIASYIVVVMPWLIHNIFSILFKRSPWEYVLGVLKGVVIAAITATICYMCCLLFPVSGIWKVVVNGMVCVIVGNVLLLLIYHKDPMFHPMLELLDRISKGKLKRLIAKCKR